MQHKIFTALPDFLSKTAKDMLFDSRIDDKTGLISWSKVVQYEYYNEFKEKLSSYNPPKSETKYNIRIFNLEAYEYLIKTGWIYDPKHTGKQLVPMVDNRTAPGA